GDDTAGYRTWQGSEWIGAPGPFQRWMLSDNSVHLWRVDLPETLPNGVHLMEITATDRHGQTFTESYTFEVVEDLPNPNWETAFWE
ncbi:MAG: phosphoesterase, partial [Pseudomonadota bacterium]